MISVRNHLQIGNGLATNWGNSIMKYLIKLALLIAFSAIAQQEGKRVYQKDSIGNIQYHKQSWIIVKGQMCPVDTVGSRLYHKPCLDIGSKEMNKAMKSEK